MKTSNSSPQTHSVTYASFRGCSVERRTPLWGLAMGVTLALLGCVRQASPPALAGSTGVGTNLQNTYAHPHIQVSTSPRDPNARHESDAHFAHYTAHLEARPSVKAPKGTPEVETSLTKSDATGSPRLRRAQ